ncbi:LacI family DNA-binding transcriptional regulator [Georgenia subflava]|uniref:Substrate-binding domain-containing protein n=1 Tax=Georgenia subflava TaxID=1622177 RepID=A0A6N7EJC7_9MICO|nr:LacI family DNA-binding transcriptional regulator [Georgenia subflava]MPV37153.1 substrate-binding domain-containing protein [Georgenia subflava]
MSADGTGRTVARARTGVTLSDVAREAGVSLATASRAINGSIDRTVRADLKERVLAAAARLHYSPDANAQAMARGRTATIGLIVHDIADPYFSSIAAGVTGAADEAGCAVTLANTHHDPRRELEFVQTLQNQRARAIILAGGRRDDAEGNEQLRAALENYQERGGTVAMIGQPILGVSTVRPDNRGGGGALADALHELGYRDVAILAGPPGHLTARERATGFRDAMAVSGTEILPDAVVPSEFTRDGGYAAMRTLIDARRVPELVFAVNDVMAVGAMSAARDAGLDVPGQVAFAGFDDIATLRDVAPALTTVRLPLEEIGRLATPLALEPAAEPREITVTGDVVVRESTPRR